MSERTFRLISGIALWIVLLLSILYQNDTFLIAYCLIFLFEGITNWRIPLIISRIRYGHSAPEVVSGGNAQVKHSVFASLEAERMMRFTMVLFIFLSYFVFPDALWFFPWYIAGMMIVSGITSICPMVMFLRWVGFR